MKPEKSIDMVGEISSGWLKSKKGKEKPKERDPWAEVCVKEVILLDV